MNPEEIAERCANIMWSEDQAAKGLGIERIEVGPGMAALRMSVRADMVNSHHICHGGFLFALADTAFAYACNAFNQITVASGADISFLAPARLGDVLTARAEMRQQGGRSGVYDVEVRNQADTLIALFRGRSARIKGQLFEDGSDKS